VSLLYVHTYVQSNPDDGTVLATYSTPRYTAHHTVDSYSYWSYVRTYLHVLSASCALSTTVPVRTYVSIRRTQHTTYGNLATITRTHNIVMKGHYYMKMYVLSTYWSTRSLAIQLSAAVTVL